MTAKSKSPKGSRVKVSPRDEGLDRIAKAIERIAICVERREERRDLVDAVSRLSLKQAAEDVGIKVSRVNGKVPSRLRVLVTPNVIGKAHAKKQAAEQHEDQG